MAVRILHCGKNITNYHLCLEQQVVGFTKRVAEEGDSLYLAVKVGNITYCGARAILSEVTDYKPWEEAELYIQCFKIKDIQYCEPFDLKILSEAGGKYWVLKYVQASKTIKDDYAITLLEDTFNSQIRDSLSFFNREGSLIQNEDTFENEQYNDDTVDNIEIQEAMTEVPEARINIMGTYQTVKFYNETDQIRGLEPLVNENFYHLFPQYPEHRTVLITDNRRFITAGIDNNGENITGIRGIPDALLIIFNREAATPFQINLIEYECYGEGKIRALDKFNYLNGHIIPQLMRFASTFSIVTDKQIREQTINSWTSKIIDYIYSSPEINAKVTNWVKELDPQIAEQRIALQIQKLLLTGLQTNLRILLIIDELTDEQKDTIKNIIKSFKLESGIGIEFLSYIFRLEQKINILNHDSDYALSVQ